MSEPNRYYRSGDDWLGNPPIISDSEIAGTFSADIIVLGGGHAGMQLAVRGAQLGLSMVVIESQEEEKHRYLGEDFGVRYSKWAAEKASVHTTRAKSYTNTSNVPQAASILILSQPM
ncbi:MAG: hypothetical protein GX111_04535 [Clostridiales bacterium]|jgi:ribosomal protein S9|nr:hypothetical protein [Clostridiales bacterium]